MLPVVEKLPCRLAWKFLCSPNTDDVSMQVVIDEQDLVLLKVDKTNASEGVLELKQTGKYSLRFDNSHSYWSSKTVGYFVKIADPFNLEGTNLSFGDSI
jgi:hypothetical protein